MTAINIRPVTDLRNRYADVESDVRKGPVFFTKNGYGASVLVSIDYFQNHLAMQEARESLSSRLQEKRRMRSAAGARLIAEGARSHCGNLPLNAMMNGRLKISMRRLLRAAPNGRTGRLLRYDFVVTPAQILTLLD